MYKMEQNWLGQQQKMSLISQFLLKHIAEMYKLPCPGFMIIVVLAPVCPLVDL